MTGPEYTHADVPDQHMEPDEDVCEGCADEGCDGCDGDCCEGCLIVDYEEDPDDARDRAYAYDED